MASKILEAKIVIIQDGNNHNRYVVKVKMSKNPLLWYYVQSVNCGSPNLYAKLENMSGWAIFKDENKAKELLAQCLACIKVEKEYTPTQAVVTPVVNNSMLIPSPYSKLYDHWFIKFLLCFIRLKK